MQEQERHVGQLPYDASPLVATHDIEQAEEVLNRQLAERREVAPFRRRRREVRLTGCRLSSLKLFGADWGQEVSVRSSPLTCWHGIRPLEGMVECRDLGVDAVAGELLLFAPGRRMNLHWREQTRAVVFALPAEVLAEHVETHHRTQLLHHHMERGWHIGRRHPALQGMTRLQDMLAAEMGAPTGLMASRAAQTQWQGLCCENLLQLLPACQSDAAPGPLPGVIKRALEYIHAHLEEPLDMAGLVVACATSRRTLEQAFRRSLQTSPACYHRRRRLEALRELLQRHRHGEVLLADLSYRWGFSQPSHLTASYKRAFGELPSETLARRPVSR